MNTSTSTSNKKIRFLKIVLKNPLTILIAIGIGILVGLYLKPLAKAIAPFGNMYLYLLQMSVIPILISAIISSISKLIRSKGIQNLLVRMLIVFFVAVFFCSILGTFAGIIGKPGNLLNDERRAVLGALVEENKTADLSVSLSAPYEEIKKQGIIDFISEIIPSNIFESLATGRAIELVFLSIILGIAIGTTKDQSGDNLTSIFVALFIAFQKIIDWAMYVLPFGLIALVANQVAKSGIDIIGAMFSMIGIFYIIGLVMIVGNTLIIQRRSQFPLAKVIRATLTPIMIAFSTRSSFACIPACVEALEEKLHFERAMTNFLIPLGITLGRYGNIVYFALVSVFLVQLYNIEFGTTEIIITILGSVLAGIATAGATGFTTLAAIQIVLSPLGVPIEVSLVILLAIDTIVDPLRTILIVQTNLMFTAVVAKRFTGERKAALN